MMKLMSKIGTDGPGSNQNRAYALMTHHVHLLPNHIANGAAQDAGQGKREQLLPGV